MVSGFESNARIRRAIAWSDQNIEKATLRGSKAQRGARVHGVSPNCVNPILHIWLEWMSQNAPVPECARPHLSPTLIPTKHFHLLPVALLPLLQYPRNAHR